MRLIRFQSGKSERWRDCKAGDYWLDDQSSLHYCVTGPTGEWIEIDLDLLETQLGALHTPQGINPDTPASYGGW